MIELSRRSILGGMLSILAAASTEIIPAPARALAGNSLPRIFGNGRDYDSEGFQALFDGKSVIIPHDKLQVTAAKGLIFHHGTFVINTEVFTNGCEIEIENAIFDGRLLKWWEAFFTHTGQSGWRWKSERKIISSAKWFRSEGHMSIDAGSMQFSTSNDYMSNANRFRPLPPKEL